MIDFRTPILNLEGEPMIAPATKDENGKVLKPSKPFLMVHACQEALTANYPDERDLSGKEKIERLALALKIANPLPSDLTTEECALIKRLVDKLYGTLIYGRVDQIFEAKPLAAIR